MASFLESPPADRHSPLEDAAALLIGTALVAVSVMLLRSGALITGQIAGLSLLVSYPSGIPFGAVFFALNLPFYWLAYRRMGTYFTLKTFAAVALLSLFTEVIPQVVTISTTQPLTAALLAGVTGGAGLLALFRHGATLGGVGIVGMYLQDTRGIKAGWVQLGFDVCVFALAFALFPALTVLYSLAGAAVLNVMIAMNHRRDRYIAK